MHLVEERVAKLVRDASAVLDGGNLKLFRHVVRMEEVAPEHQRVLRSEHLLRINARIYVWIGG